MFSIAVQTIARTNMNRKHSRRCIPPPTDELYYRICQSTDSSRQLCRLGMLLLWRAYAKGAVLARSRKNYRKKDFSKHLF